MFVLSFNKSGEFVLNKYPVWPWYYDMVFLLLDDPYEAYKFSLLKRPIRHDLSATLESIVRIGRKRNIYLWDLKVLACLSLGVQLVAESFQIQISATTHDYIDPFIDPLFPPGIDYGNVKVFAKWCLKIKGKEHTMFNPFRIRLHKIFHDNSSVVVRMLRGLHLKFYGRNMDNILDNKLCNNVVSPLVIILQFMSDGHLIDTGNVDDLDRLLEPFRKQNSKGIVNIFPPNRLRRNAGVYVSRGECLIINQLFENDVKCKREGTLKDELELVNTFQHLGCRDSITVKRDLTKSEMITAFQKFRLRLKSTSPDFMVVVILSHGKKDDYIMDINMNGVKLRKITNMFNDGHKCSSMIGKPKFFFVQACRGTETQDPQLLKPRYVVMIIPRSCIICNSFVIL